MTYEAYMQSAEWRTMRLNVMIRDRFRCRGCKAVGSKEVRLTVHHKKGYDPRKQDKPSDLVTLCRDCHEYLHRKNGWVVQKLHGRYFEWGKKRSEMKKTVTYRKTRFR